MSVDTLPLRAWAVDRLAAALPEAAALGLRRRALLAYLPVSGPGPAGDTPFGTLGMLSLAIENALQDSAYEDLAVDLLHRFAAATALAGEAGDPLLAIASTRRLPPGTLHRLPRLAAVVRAVAAAGGPVSEPGKGSRGPREVTFSVLSQEQLPRVLARVFDAQEFLSSSGLRVTSPQGGALAVRAPANLLALTGLREAARAWGGRLTLELPTGSGRRVTLGAAADELRGRLLARSVAAGAARGWPAGWPFWPEALDGDTGEGIGSGDSLPWAALVVATAG